MSGTFPRAWSVATIREPIIPGNNESSSNHGCRAAAAGVREHGVASSTARRHAPQQRTNGRINDDGGQGRRDSKAEKRGGEGKGRFDDESATPHAFCGPSSFSGPLIGGMMLEQGMVDKGAWATVAVAARARPQRGRRYVEEHCFRTRRVGRRKRRWRRRRRRRRLGWGWEWG